MNSESPAPQPLPVEGQRPASYDWLIPFAGLEWTCPKCGGTDYHLAFKPSTQRCYSTDTTHPYVYRGDNFEHHHRTCRTCGFARAEGIAPAQPAPVSRDTRPEEQCPSRIRGYGHNFDADGLCRFCLLAGNVTERAPVAEASEDTEPARCQHVYIEDYSGPGTKRYLCGAPRESREHDTGADHEFVPAPEEIVETTEERCEDCEILSSEHDTGFALCDKHAREFDAPLVPEPAGDGCTATSLVMSAAEARAPLAAWWQEVYDEAKDALVEALTRAEDAERKLEGAKAWADDLCWQQMPGGRCNAARSHTIHDGYCYGCDSDVPHSHHMFWPKEATEEYWAERALTPPASTAAEETTDA